MIERLLTADRALADGQVEVAERLFGQVAAADPRNAIAVVGLARCARQRGDLGGAEAYARRALEIDPDDVAARLLVEELAAAAPTPASAPAPAPPARRGGLVAWLRRRILGRD